MRQTLDFTQEYCAAIQGWLEPAEVEWLWTEAGKLPKDGCWTEVGVWKGKSYAATVLGATPGSSVYAVDTFLGTPSEIRTYHQEAMNPGDPIFKAFNDNLGRLQAIRTDVTCRFIRSFSMQVANDIVPRTLDRVFLDAAHDYASVLTDILVWHRNVKDGGKLIGHDFEFSEVQRALGDCGFELKNGPIDIWWIQK